MKTAYGFLGLVCFLLLSCNSDPSLQKYFVKNTENKDFIVLDVSPAILNVDQTKLTVAQKEALHSFDKMNILAFKLNDKNKAQFEIERAKVDLILKDKKYQQLMKFTSGKEGVSVSFVGSDNHIEEFVLFVNKKENGFAVVRILGKDMNTSNIMILINVLRQSNIDLEQLKSLQQLLKH